MGTKKIWQSRNCLFPIQALSLPTITVSFLSWSPASASSQITNVFCHFCFSSPQISSSSAGSTRSYRPPTPCGKHGCLARWSLIARCEIGSRQVRRFNVVEHPCSGTGSGSKEKKGSTTERRKKPLISKISSGGYLGTWACDLTNQNSPLLPPVYLQSTLTAVIHAHVKHSPRIRSNAGRTHMCLV